MPVRRWCGAEQRSVCVSWICLLAGEPGVHIITELAGGAGMNGLSDPEESALITVV